MNQQCPNCEYTILEGKLQMVYDVLHVDSRMSIEMILHARSIKRSRSTYNSIANALRRLELLQLVERNLGRSFHSNRRIYYYMALPNG